MVIALHNQGTLELETLNATSRACAEAWSVAGSWRGLEQGRAVVSVLAARIRDGILDSDGLSYKGEPVQIV